MKFLKKHASTILISFAMGIFLFYMQPILNFVGNKVVDFFIRTSETFSSMYYESIAINDPYAFDYFNSTILTFASIALIVYFIRFIIIERKDISRQTEKNVEKINSYKKKLNNNNNDEQAALVKDDLIKKFNELESSILAFNSDLDKYKNYLIAFIIYASFICLLVTSKYVVTKSITDENVSFKNQTIILLPIVGDQKINQLKSDWTQMKNSFDYAEIMKSIEELKKNQNQEDVKRNNLIVK